MNTNLEGPVEQLFNAVSGQLNWSQRFDCDRFLLSTRTYVSFEVSQSPQLERSKLSLAVGNHPNALVRFLFMPFAEVCCNLWYCHFESQRGILHTTINGTRGCLSLKSGIQVSERFSKVE